MSSPIFKWVILPDPSMPNSHFQSIVSQLFFNKIACNLALQANIHSHRHHWQNFISSIRIIIAGMVCILHRKCQFALRAFIQNLRSSDSSTVFWRPHNGGFWGSFGSLPSLLSSLEGERGPLPGKLITPWGAPKCQSAKVPTSQLANACNEFHFGPKCGRSGRNA